MWHNSCSAPGLPPTGNTIGQKGELRWCWKPTNWEMMNFYIMWLDLSGSLWNLICSICEILTLVEGISIGMPLAAGDKNWYIWLSWSWKWVSSHNRMSGSRKLQGWLIHTHSCSQRWAQWPQYPISAEPFAACGRGPLAGFSSGGKVAATVPGIMATLNPGGRGCLILVFFF